MHRAALHDREDPVAEPPVVRAPAARVVEGKRHPAPGMQRVDDRLDATRAADQEAMLDVLEAPGRQVRRAEAQPHRCKPAIETPLDIHLIAGLLVLSIASIDRQPHAASRCLSEWPLKRFWVNARIS